ncbi:alpha-galactosidase [Cohnella thailandensis]|uniref:Alpha-galactosidase n=1 Tax=Cohnella thailandensis TaxID=557557 RepID=A0A841SVF1_9BACL|nr:alpha-galactosidase [Cohnella thailandensis]MBB6635232.1 alpha-galactosidase [Cohnella thailandensis]MBP1974300.1 hypothetical protein [Cohnella thailandensis]
MMLKMGLRMALCLTLIAGLLFTGIPFAKDTQPQEASAAGAGITKNGNTWTLENDVLRVVVVFSGGSIEMTSFYNKAAGREYLTGGGSKHLFYYDYEGSDLYSNDGGWTLGTDAITDIDKFGANWGKELVIPITRTTPHNVTVRLKFELYNDKAGLRYYNTIQNNDSSEKTIGASDIIALNFPNDAHTIHYVPNMTWSSTTGALAPNTGRNAITRYDTGDGWIVQPEMNWKTQDAPDRLPFAAINAWSGIDGVKVSTNPGSLQLVLFPGEEFEYIAVDMTAFVGDSLDGRMAMEEHFRKRFKYHDTSSVFIVNDWEWLNNRTESYYRNTVIPKAVQAGMDMIMPDDLWNVTRDSTTPVSSFTNDLQSLTDTIVANGMKFGLWFSMTGDNHNAGRDLADPANIEFKRGQVEDFMIPNYNLSHQMIDLTEYWPNAADTATSHVSDSVYRKNVLVRNYMNDVVSRNPDFLMKVTSEVDIYPTQGDRNIGLLHIGDNGFVSSKGNVDKEILIGMNHFGYLPMSSVYYGGLVSGKTEDYYSHMLARAIKYAKDPATWSAAGIATLKKFNDWRKSPRIKELTDGIVRPLYAGPNYDTTGPYAWMYAPDDKSKALLIVTAAGMDTAVNDVTLNLRWLDSSKTYLVEDVSMDDNGTINYKFKGRFTGAQLKAPGFTVNLGENTSRGKAFYFQKDNATADLQVLYADEKIASYTTSAGESTLTVTATGASGTTGKVILYDRSANKTVIREVAIGSGGTGSVMYESGFKHEAETLPITMSAGGTNANGTDSLASGGALSYANGNAVGGWAQYTVNVPSSGTYNVKVRVKKHPDRGIGQLYIDGVAQGAPVDQYASTQSFVEVNLGDKTFSSAGDKAFRFELTGKNAASGQYTLATDSIRLTYRSPDLALPPLAVEPARYEAESLTATVSSGGSTAVGADGSASGGSLAYGNPGGVGGWVQYAVNVPEPGTYNVKVRVKKHPDRGIAQLYVDGVAVGSPVDQYQSSPAFVTVDLGNVTVASSGSKAFRFQSTGKNAASSQYTLATDLITLTRQPTSLEAESLTTTVSSGDSSANSADSAASGGSLNYSGFNAVGDWVQYAVSVPAPGTYSLSARVKKHPDRGTAQLYVDGTPQSYPIDLYSPVQGYEIVSLGTITFGSAGNKAFKFQIAGKDPGSNSYTLAFDNLRLMKL